MDAEERAHSFMFQSVPKRAAIVVAGPVANFILAIVIFAAVFMVYGKQTMSARVDAVQPGSAAAAAGFEAGDLVVSIDGQAVDNFAQMQRIVGESAGETLAITVRGRRDESAEGDARPSGKEGCFGNVHHWDPWHSAVSSPGGFEVAAVALPQAVWLGMEESWDVVDQTLTYVAGS